MLEAGRFVGAALVALGMSAFAVACSTSIQVDPGADAGPPNVDPNPNGKGAGETCADGSECRTGVCTAGVCQDATNKDGIKNGQESDVDCGGPAGPGCASGKQCRDASDCLSGMCNGGVCGGSSGKDGVKNGMETDVDCGGPAPDVDRCGDGKGCLDGKDCQSKVCEAGKCKAASPTDGVQNGDETDVDCGGAKAPKCDFDKGCKVGGDCGSGVCKAGKCVAPSANDGIKNGNETDVDCGGGDPGTPKCADGKDCNLGDDCVNAICNNAKKCDGPSFNDGIKNGTETDVDCGGPAAGPRCDTGKQCLVHADCASNGCAYDNTCASHPSCTQLEGGYTCGANDVAGKQEDCCASAAVGGYTVDKHLITAGRMRAFLDRFNGNIRAYAAALPAAQWNQAYTNELPANYDEANTQLGPFYDKRACETGSSTGHTFWTPPTFGDTKDFSKAVLDTKALNCVPWWITAAFCVWDGGHLTTEAELRAAYTNANTTAYPWGAIGTYVTNAQNDFAIQYYSYATPNPPANARRNGEDYLDIAFYIAPPGRRPNGYNVTGHTDMVGNLLEWVGDRDRQFVWKGSFERHASEADFYTPGPNDPWLAKTSGGAPWQWGYNIGTGRPGDGRGVGYYGIGARCSR
ncbi:MAG: SUMF1/EgtB/PvdO family nonheme iron enzyme [Myxococcales bacterium]|nr:SUMF1/EgtB/PvdO family nonheme iron enzyme [Myxococcales bacterium]